MITVYEGKAKQIFQTQREDQVIIVFKDSVTAYNGIKKDNLLGKGRINLAFTKYFFELLHSKALNTHILSYIDENSLLVRKLEIIPIELVIRNYAAGSICKRLGIGKGSKFDPPLLEIYLKNDMLGDPILCKEHLRYINIISDTELQKVEQIALSANSIITNEIEKKGLILVDFKLEFGRTNSGEILLADEISPDTCRFWFKKTMESLDKDVYRENKGDLIDTYLKLAKILGIKI